MTDYSPAQAYPHTGAGVLAEKGRRGIGHQVRELPPDCELLMSLGTGRTPGDGPEHFRQPSNVSVTPGGEIPVADGHCSGANNRVVRFSSQGGFIG